MGGLLQKETVLVTGASGQLGQSLQYVLQQQLAHQKTSVVLDSTPIHEQMATFPAGHDYVFLDRNQLDLSPRESLSQDIDRLIEEHRPKAFIHAAAYTQVDAAELDEQAAFHLNETATDLLAKACAARNILFIYLSTDFVFGGKNIHQKPFLPLDPIAPEGVYARSKAAGEKAVQGAAGPHYIVRTSWVFSPFGHNFVKTMLRLAQERLSFLSEQNQQTSDRNPPTISVVADQFGCPTSALDLARALILLIATKASPYGIHHYSNTGTAHWAQLAGAIFEQRNLPITVKPISTEDFAAPAPRPHFSVLENTLDPKARHWKEALAEALSILKTA